MKLKEGNNTFRVLSSAVTGYEYWDNQNKVIRSKKEFVGVPENIKVEANGKSKINFFIAFIVWNCEAKKIQMLSITQKTIQKYIIELKNNPAWSSPKGYDITINKSGSGLTTKYSCVANPPSPTDPAVLEMYSKMKIDLEALFVGGEIFK